MLAVSQQFQDALEVSHNLATVITVTPPGGDPTELRWSACQVTSGNDSGVRYSASLSVIPQEGVDLYSILSTPGAVYRIEHGIDFGAGDPELIPMGVYEASQGSINIIEGSINLSLVDNWMCLERARFLSPVTANGADFASRAELIQAVVDTAYFLTGTYPGGFNIIDDGGGMVEGDRVWERDRVQMIRDIATDGALDVYFDAAGVFTMRPQPIIDVDAPTVWTFRTGPASNILTADRERPFDRLYNAVSVMPTDDEQTWQAEQRVIEDVTNPRHPDNVGQVVPIYFASPTISDQDEAALAADTILQRVQGTTETVNLGALGNPALEVGDCVTIAHEATPSDPGFNAVHMIDGFNYDLATGAMTLATKSSTLVDVEEA